MSAKLELLMKVASMYDTWPGQGQMTSAGLFTVINFHQNQFKRLRATLSYVVHGRKEES